MGMKIELDVSDQDIRAAKGKIDDFIREVSIELSNQLKLEAPTDRGQLRQSINVINREKGSYTVAVKSRHAMPIQSGTEAFTPPMEPLAEWGRRKLGARSAGKAVWNKIRNEGIDENPFATRAIQNLEDKYT